MGYDRTEAERVVRRRSPEVSETPLCTQRALLTAPGKMYRRNHFPVPEIAADTWRLVVAGAVAAPFDLTLDDLAAFPIVERTTVLECAGNGGSSDHLQRGGFGVVRWSGVPLSALLARAIPDEKAGPLFVTVHAADTGRDPDEDESVRTYERSIPLDVAMSRGMLAVAMNSGPIPADHGHPARLVVPGWYGHDWVKWVTALEVTTRESRSVYMTRRYRAQQDEQGFSYGDYVRTMAVKSVITDPEQYETCRQALTVSGLAWTGLGRITEVELRVNGGPWRTTDLAEEADDGAVVRWSTHVDDLQPGFQTLETRATDSHGRRQPRVPSGLMYEANHVSGLAVLCVSD